MSTLFTPVTPVTPVTPAGAEHPFRERGALGGSWVRFESSSGFAILVDRSVQAWLVSRAARSAPSETYGLLLGRTFRDGAGPFVVVESAVQVRGDGGSAACVIVDGLEVHELRRRASVLYPCLDVIGWWHTHTVASGFSATDRDEQRTWGPDQVGVVVFMEDSAGGPWAFAYRGPHAEVLDPVEAGAGGPTERSRPPGPGSGPSRPPAPPPALAGVDPFIERDSTPAADSAKGPAPVAADPPRPRATPPLPLGPFLAIVMAVTACALFASAAWGWSR